MGRTGNETVLLYNLDNDKGRKIRVILIQLGMKIRNVKKEEFGEPVGELIGLGISETSGKVQAATDAALRSQEAPGIPGLGILKGKILKIPAGEGLKIPHMGWNSLELKKEHEALSGK